MVSTRGICDFISRVFWGTMGNLNDKPNKVSGKKDGTTEDGNGNGAFTPLLKELGERLQKRRQELGMSQEEVCEQVDMNRTYLSDIERGFGNVSILLLFKLSKALQVDLSSLLRDIEKVVVGLPNK